MPCFDRESEAVSKRARFQRKKNDALERRRESIAIHQSSWLAVFSKIREHHKAKGERSRRTQVTESGVEKEAMGDAI
jgi:hypothetical protein